MKKVFALIALLISFSAFAEPSFQQVESLIEKQQYAAAESGLEQIIQNHPNSAKAYYAMAQAQAGLGNQQKAQIALDKARGIDPDLKFASSSNIDSLQQAITPQTKKIEVVEESHFWRNALLIIALAIIGYFVLFRWILRKDDTDEGQAPTSGGTGDAPKGPNTPQPSTSTAYAAGPSKYGSTASAPSMSHPSITPAPAPVTASVQPAPQPTVVNNHYGSSNDGLLTGVLLGEMMSNHHDHTTVIERDVYVSPPAPSYTPPPSHSSWDDDSSSSSSSSSSSWDDDSSSKSSSSWSSSSSSDSSWDSGSSSSDSSWDSSSSSSSSDW